MPSSMPGDESADSHDTQDAATTHDEEEDVKDGHNLRRSLRARVPKTSSAASVKRSAAKRMPAAAASKGSAGAEDDDNSPLLRRGRLSQPRSAAAGAMENDKENIAITIFFGRHSWGGQAKPACFRGPHP